MVESKQSPTLALFGSFLVLLHIQDLHPILRSCYYLFTALPVRHPTKHVYMYNNVPSDCGK